MKIIGGTKNGKYLFEGSAKDFAAMLGFKSTVGDEFRRQAIALEESGDKFDIDTSINKTKKEVATSRFLRGVAKRDLTKLKSLLNKTTKDLTAEISKNQKLLDEAIDVVDKIQIFETIKEVSEKSKAK